MKSLSSFISTSDLLSVVFSSCLGFEEAEVSYQVSRMLLDIVSVFLIVTW